MQDKQAAQAYWKENIRLLLSLPVVWFVVSFGCGILFVEQLSKKTTNATWRAMMSLKQ